MNECNIVRDLIPLYGDNLLSADSLEYIQAHVSTCPECNLIWQRAKQDLPQIQTRNADAEKAIIRKALRRDRLKTAGKTLLIVLLMLIPLCFYTFLTLREWGYFYPIEATFPSPDESQIVELVEPEHLLNPGEAYLIRFRLPKGYLNRYPTQWTSIDVHWAPDSIHLLLSVTTPEGLPEIRILDTTVMRSQGGTIDIPGMTDNLIPILKELWAEEPGLPPFGSEIQFSFDSWEPDSASVILNYETDAGDSGQISYHYPSQTLNAMP